LVVLINAGELLVGGKEEENEDEDEEEEDDEADEGVELNHPPIRYDIRR